MSYIEVKDVVKVFDDNVAVDHVNFKVNNGEIFGFLGPNGAGKTTTIRMIMNITMPDSGEILFDGQLMKESLKDNIGYLPEERGLYPKMKVQDILEFLGNLKGMSLNDVRRAIDHWLGRLEIDSWRDKKIEELSKGMQQKIQFVATILHDPDMVIFDEPFSGLDPINVDVLRDIILEMKAKNKIVFFSTHVMEKAEQLCDEIFLINGGKGVLDGTLTEIKEKFSENEIFLEFEGDPGFIKNLSYVSKVDIKDHTAVIALKDIQSRRQLLTDVTTKLDITSFYPKEKTLHEIFVSQVGGNHA